MQIKIVSRPHFRIQTLAAVAALLFASAALGAQSPAARILAAVDSSQLAAIPGSQNNHARAAADLGRMPANAPISRITLRFNRSAAQEAALDSLLAAQLNPSSPLYHQWLTPDQFAARFGMAQSDIDKVQSWLLQQGFTVDGVNRSLNAIHFSGTVAQIESAFATQMHYFQVNGEKHFAPSTALSVPAAIAPVVADIHNLDDFRPRADVVHPRANFTSSVSGNVFFAPPDIVTTYDIGPLYSASVKGNGQTIAVVGQSAVTVSDIEAFQVAANLNKKDPDLLLVPGTGDSTTYPDGNEAEGDLDLEWSGAIAPGANLVFVYTGNSLTYGAIDAADYAIDEDIANIINISFSLCEPDAGSSYVTSEELVFKQAAAQGQTIVAASGDQGSAACYGDPNVGSTLAEQSQESVNYPASSAYVTGVGGTEVTTQDVAGGADFSTYWQSANGSDVLSSAIKYIPEVTWNDNSDNCGVQNCLSATGGGTSTLVDRPSWQSGVPGIPSGSKRLVPDIAFYASPALPGYLMCTGDTSFWNPGGSGSVAQQASCNQGFRDNATGDLIVAGGTSFASPIFAGMVALLNQNGNYTTGSGLVNPTLYTKAAISATYSADFHDVTTGNNNCNVAADCSSNVGFSAGAGYDEVTGLGSIDVDKLAKVWPAASAGEAALIGTTVSVQPANANPNENQSDIFTITVADDKGNPVTTGTVTLQIDGGTDCGGLSGDNCGGTTKSKQPLNASGQVTYTATFATAGIHSIVAQYSGDATHAAATGAGSASVAVVSSGKGTITVGATPSTLTVSQGNTGTETITIKPHGGYTGTVNVNIDFGSADNALTNLCAGFSTFDQTTGLGVVQISGTQAGSVSLQLDTNASDCVAVQKGTGQLRRFMKGGMAKNTPPAPHRSPLPPAAALAGLALVGYLGRRSRNIRNLIAVLALAAAGLMISACGSSVSTSGGPPNPPKGTYTGTVKATDSSNSSITATTTFKFVID